jgi:predicted flap endonuclease-1-like 5' DNA nuclease
MSLFERLNRVKSRTAEPVIRQKRAQLASIPGGREVSSRFGQFVLLEDSSAETFPFPQNCKEPIQNNLRLIRGIGPCHEEKLRDQGLTKICDLLEHPRWGNYALKRTGIDIKAPCS